ncbi:MucR family transcriptional regulator [Sphingomonas carotinifaciens]|uniref:Predicted transcriptional regulator n=1 Tax=Sphingomonas carotinifaciens TaxID=1166323 RepID=A0A1G7PW92_9SPHN|nr:MucR family transcriptional regulator [Sphingomonas carotinifaciens]MBB4087508.1 putative transcriptional regulator [Sphingomonas carotinifaciens]SDF89869.1 Predicted transcriptional regulator [Sphingomonas carotinifaciens]
MTDTVNAIVLATELTAAWLSNPNTRADADAVPAFLTSIHASLATLASGEPQQGVAAPEPAEHVPAVTVRKSLASPDRIISMIDGKPYRMLRRHLSTHGLTPDEYRSRYKLKADYPMVAPAYSEARRDMAKKIGLGRKPKAAAAVEPAAAPAPTRKPRRAKGAAPAD